MQLPIVAPAPIVAAHAGVFRDLFENRCQFQHFQNYLTGLMVLPNKTMANIARCTLDSADKTNLSRFFAEAPWLQEQVNDQRLAYVQEKTQKVCRSSSESLLVIDDTLCAHVGGLFEYVDRHYDHADDSFPLAHNPVTSHFVSGAVRFPVDWRLYRRYEELTRWEEFVHKHFPQREVPKKRKERMRLHKEADTVLLQDSEFAALHQQFRTKIDLAVELLEGAVQRGLAFDTLVFDGWYLSEELVRAAERRQKDWISLLKKNRNLETASFALRDASGQRVALEGPHISVEKLVPLIPAHAYREMKVKEKSYWTFTLTVRIPSLGKVRLVISFGTAELSGTYIVLVSNRADWSAQRMIEFYLQRWPVETFYQDGKEHLGLDEYRMRRAEAIGKHWCLVFVAYSLLHLDCLPSSPTKSGLPLKTIGEACRQQAQALIQALLLWVHERLQRGLKPDDVFVTLFAKQHLVTI
jgi:hypothetical protein